MQSTQSEKTRDQAMIDSFGNGCDIEWEDLRIEVNGKPIISKLSGKFKAGSFVALMGPSGAGKSTFMNALAGRTDSNLDEFGKIFVNGKLRDGRAWYDMMGYVVQKFTFVDKQTVAEALEFAADCKGVYVEEKTVLVDKILSETGISHRKNEYIENLSGGELARLKTGLELMVDPKIMFLDEPTSGLDSYRADELCKLLKKLTNQGKTIIITIHQPSSELLKYFDQIYLMSLGKLVYQGTVEGGIDFFGKQGYPLPEMTCPTDHFLSVVAVNFDTKETVDVDSAKIKMLHTAFKRQTHNFALENHPTNKMHRYFYKNKIWQLFKRSLLETVRNRSFLIFYLVQKVLLGGLVCASLINFYDTNYKTVIEFRYVKLVCSYYVMVEFMSIVGFSYNTFVAKRSAMVRERMTGYFSGLEIVVAKFLSLMVFVFCYESAFILGTMTFAKFFKCGGAKWAKVLLACTSMNCFTLAMGIFVSILAKTSDSAQIFGVFFTNLFVAFHGGFFACRHTDDEFYGARLGALWKTRVKGISNLMKEEWNLGRATGFVDCIFKIDPCFYVYNYLIFTFCDVYYYYCPTGNQKSPYFTAQQGLFKTSLSHVLVSCLGGTVLFLLLGALVLHYSTKTRMGENKLFPKHKEEDKSVESVKQEGVVRTVEVH